MAASNANIDVIVSDSADRVPCCPHGPALLFERFVKNEGNRRFYACSAFRDRKQCSFFCWADDRKGKSNRDTTHHNIIADSSTELGNGLMLNRSASRKRFLKFKKQPLSKRWLCCTCGLLLLEGEVKQHGEQGHEIKHRILHAALRRPTTLFTPHEDNKTFAQYLFSESTVDFILTSLENLNISHVLCVGAPRIHEAVILRAKEQKTNLRSLLLDLDSRYAQVYSHKKLCLYNMFNHHFFDPKGEAQFQSFVKEGGGGLVLLTDPPFGGMVEPLAATFKKIEAVWRVAVKSDEDLPVLWFFPYFMEKRICENMPALSMLDYKVDYDNHSLFKSKDGKRKKGSPVRIFTNISPTSLPLPSSEGYWFCEVCQRYSAPENKHCQQCNSCTSKDGTTYTHCDLCQRCVKSTRVHCTVCNTCELPSHTCGKQHGEGCHLCGDLGHKRRDCPERHTSPNSRTHSGKRPAKGPPVKVKKKRCK